MTETNADAGGRHSLRFSGSIAALNHARVCANLRRRNQPWLMRRGLFVLIGVFILSHALALIYSAQTQRLLPDWVAYVQFILFFGALFAFQRWRQRHVQTAVRDTPARSGVTTYDLSPKGVTVTHPLGHSFLRWPAILCAVDDPQGLLLLTGPLEYIVIPTSAFADAGHRHEVLEQANRWISGSRDLD
jgi:hypothetical protein